MLVRNAGVFMLPLTLFLCVVLALILWRLLFAALRSSALVPETPARRNRNGNFVFLFRSLTAGADSFHRVDLVSRNERAKAYLRRIVALTGARQTDTNDGYVLDVGATRFYVRGRYVQRQRDVNDPKSAFERTCYCLPYMSMPEAEQIASALLQLSNNPALFDRWLVQSGAFKADGQGFGSVW